MKIKLFHTRILKIQKNKISRWNQENHKKLLIPRQNREKHEIPNIQSQNHKHY